MGTKYLLNTAVTMHNAASPAQEHDKVLYKSELHNTVDSSRSQFFSGDD